MKYFILLAVLTLGLFISPAVAQQEPNQVDSGGIGGRPALPREDNPRTKSIFIQTLEPGSFGKDAVRVINNAEETKQILVYAADTALSNDGAFACGQLVDETSDVGSWISLAKNELTLKPSTSEVVNFTINVPKNADVGEHNGCIVIQEAKENSNSEQGIGLSFRSAIRVAILVPGDVRKELSIEQLKASTTSDEVTLTPFVKNSGNVSVDATISSQLITVWGRDVSDSGGEFPVLREQTGVWNFTHEKPFWGGIYKSATTVSYSDNQDNFIGEQAENNITLRADGPLLFVPPAPLALLIELAAILLVVGSTYKFTKQQKVKKTIEATWITYKVKKADDIKSVAATHNTSWKKIAKVNSLKPPFTINEGDELKVPPKNQTKKQESEA